MGAVPLMGVPEFNFIMNRDVIRMLFVCGAICGGVACVWYLSGRDGESGAERRTVAGRGGRGGGGEGESGGNNQSDNHMNESGGESQKGMSMLRRCINIDHSIRRRLNEDPGITESMICRY